MVGGDASANKNKKDNFKLTKVHGFGLVMPPGWG